MSSLTAAPPARRANVARGASTIALALILTCQLMVILDATIVTIALPDIQNTLHFSPTSLSWVQNAYSLTFGGLLLLGARAGDILGRRRVLMAGIVLFTAASLLGGLAQSAEWLLAARAAQGVGAAIAAPSTLALLTSSFPEGPERMKAIGLYSAVSSGGASVGLVLGGMLTDWTSWRWSLFINVPIGVLLVLLAPRYLPETDRQPGRFDLAGAVTSTLGMSALVYGFVRAASDGWSDPLTVTAFVAGAALLALFVNVEMRASQPITPLRMFASRERSSSYVARLLLVGGMFGMFYFATQFLQVVLGFSPVQAGLAFLPMTVLIFGVSRVAARLLGRFPPIPLAVAGIVPVIAGMAWLSRVSPATAYFPGIVGPMILFGAGIGLAFVPLTTAALAGVRPEDSGAASSMVNVTQQVGGALGLAVLVTVFGAASHGASGHEALVHGMASAFAIATVFDVGALLVMASAAVAARRASRPREVPLPSRAAP